MVTNNRGEAATVVILVLALLGVSFFAFKPKALHGDSKRAQESQESTAQLIQASEKPAAVAAASVVKIGEVAAMLPDSVEKEFITRETPVALANLPAPDPQALLDAERRKVAILTGQVTEARWLYDRAIVKADKLQKERDEALLRKQQSDQALLETAAARIAAERQRNQFIIVAVVAALLYLYAKITHFSPNQIFRSVRDIRAGVDPVTAIDVSASPIQQKIVGALTKWRE